MVETEPIKSRIEVDSTQSNAAIGKFKNVFMSAAIGGIAGFVVGAIKQNDATSAIFETLANVLAATMLPIAVSLIPLLKEVAQVIGPLADGLEMLISFIAAKSPEARAGTSALVFGGITRALTKGSPWSWPLTFGVAIGAAENVYLKEGLKPVNNDDSHAAPQGTKYNAPGGTTVEDPNATVRLPGPLPIPINRDRLQGRHLVA